MALCATPERVELRVDDLERVIAQTKKGKLSGKERRKLEMLLESYVTLMQKLESKDTSIRSLRGLVFGQKSEKASKVVPSKATEGGKKGPASKEGKPSGKAGAKPENKDNTDKKKPKGHGRNGAADYPGAERVPVEHETLKSGDRCPECTTGTLYSQNPGLIVRLLGSPPIEAKIYERERLRCNPCGEVFTAEAPRDAGEEKADASAKAMIALLKYGSGLPFNRLEGLQGSMGIPLPASTQWEIIRDAARDLEVIHEELIRAAAGGEVLHNDDTGVKILQLLGKKPGPEEGIAADRTGQFTTGIVSIREGRRIALFFSGRRHAGENLARVLSKRAQELEAPIQMCDALSRNLPKDLEVIVGNCLVHGRRNFVKILAIYPDECTYVIEALSEVYRVDAEARKNRLTAEERLALHQEKSAPVMKSLETWLEEQIAEKKVEPNSALGGAIQYMQNHWKKLTLFLRKAQAPLDNNVCERILKRAILHRKNALFYKTQRGADAGDLFMSLIVTAELTKANPFEYLTQLLVHREELAKEPEQWMPWNYRARLDDSG